MNVSVFSLAVTIAGTFIGAGFVSGQELWQFFGAFGVLGILGFILAVTIITVLSVITISYASSAKKETFEDVICSNDTKAQKNLVSLFQYIFYIGIYIIMTSGAESLICHYFDIKKVTVGIIFCVLVSIISLIGVKGIISAFSVTIPLLVFVTAIIAIFTLSSIPVCFRSVNDNSLISNWFVSALVFVSYNFFAGIGVFASVARLVNTKKKLFGASVLGCVFLLIIGVCVITTISFIKTETSDLPMLEAAELLSPYLSTIYAVLLVCAMFGGAISSLFPIVESIKSKNIFDNKTLAVITSLISAVTVILSLFGFSNLIGTVYPIFGYIGFVVIIVVIYNFAKHKIGGKQC